MRCERLSSKPLHIRSAQFKLAVGCRKIIWEHTCENGQGYNLLCATYQFCTKPSTFYIILLYLSMFYKLHFCNQTGNKLEANKCLHIFWFTDQNIPKQRVPKSYETSRCTSNPFSDVQNGVNVSWKPLGICPAKRTVLSSALAPPSKQAATRPTLQAVYSTAMESS